jgi:ribosomal protein L11 methyltransferase
MAGLVPAISFQRGAVRPSIERAARRVWIGQCAAAELRPRSAGMIETIAARLTCDERTARRVAFFLAESLDGDETACAAFENPGGQWEVAVHMQGAPDETQLRDLVRVAAGEDAAQALRFEPVSDADWVRQSLEGLKPVRAGRFLVHGSHDRERVRPNEIGIEIEAALAFGTGHHGTTRGCLLALDALAKRWHHALIPPPERGRVASKASRVGVGRKKKTPPRSRCARSTLPLQGRDKRVLDIGTGSGVLAIAAAKRLRTSIVASDIDSVAVSAARNNARLNRAPHIAFIHAPGAGARTITRQGPFDLVFANILLGPLTRLAVPIRRLAAPNARVVLSGLLPLHANAALAHYAAQGFHLERRIPLDGWMTLVLRRGCARGRGR